jgi:hypothetical protein
VPVTGAWLSALVPTPAGFTLNRSRSSDSGKQEVIPIPGAPDTNGVSCASWWSGKAYIGPGTVGYTIRSYTGPDRISLDVGVNIYPAGTGPSVYATVLPLHRRCLHFSYLDKDGLHYAVNATIVPLPGIGDRAEGFDATETAPDGSVFVTQSTVVEVGDALVSATETGPADAPVNRAALSLAAIAAGLRSAGY